MASTKISAMTAATDLASSVIPIVQGGVNKKAADTLFIKNGAVNTLTAATQINSNFSTGLYGSGNFLIEKDAGGGEIGFVICNGTSVGVGRSSNAGGAEFSVNDTLKALINSTSEIVFSGIDAKYDTDYSGGAGITDRSIMDKGYIDTAVSDIRLKENITDLPESTSLIMALRPVEFDFIKSKEHKAGFIAQEIEEVFPGMVVESESGIKKIKRDQLIPYLVKCI